MFKQSKKVESVAFLKEQVATLDDLNDLLERKLRNEKNLRIAAEESMVDYHNENRSLLSRLNTLNDENMMLINRITGLTSVNKADEKDTDSSSLTSYSHDLSGASHIDMESELEKAKAELVKRDQEFADLETCFANYRREVQVDLDELSLSQKCRVCQKMQTALDETETELKETELTLTRERRSHSTKQTYFEHIIAGYQTQIDELKGQLTVRDSDLHLAQHDEMSTLEPLKRSTAQPLIQLNGAVWTSSSSSFTTSESSSEEEEDRQQRDSVIASKLSERSLFDTIDC